MTRSSQRRTNPWALLFPSTLILLMVLLGSTLPIGDARRFLLGGGLILAVILALACIFVGSAHVATVEEDITLNAALNAANNEILAGHVAALQAKVAKVEREFMEHAAVCPCAEPAELETMLKLIPGGQPRSAS